MSKTTSRTSTPRADAQKECFDLLNRAYVEARYNPRYRITRKQLIRGSPSQLGPSL
jgi:hypothetical protein